MRQNTPSAQTSYGTTVRGRALLPELRTSVVQASRLLGALGVATLLALGASGVWSPTAHGQSAAGYYNPRTGEVFFELEANIGVVAINTAGLFNGSAAGSIGAAGPVQYNADNLAYFNPSGLQAGYWPIGSVTQTGLEASDFNFAYTPLGSDTILQPMGIIDEPAATLSGYIATRTTNSVVYQIDLNTGAQTALGPSGVSHILALEYFNGVLYAAAENGLYSIDTATGVGSLIAAAGVSIADLAAGPDGILYGNAAYNSEDQLLRIDVASGQATAVGSLAPYISTYSLAVDSNGRMIGWDRGAKWLFNIDLDTGATSSIGALSIGQFNSLIAMDYGSDGVLYGLGESGVVYRIDSESLTAASVRNFADFPYSFTLITDPEPFWNKQGPGAFAFDDAANWTPAGVPTTDRDAYFVLAGDVTALIGPSSAARHLSIRNGIVRFAGDGPAVLTVAESATIDDAFASSLNDGAVLVVDGEDGPLSAGVLENLLVAQQGFGRVRVENGASLYAEHVYVGDGGNGEITVTGPGSALIGTLQTAGADLTVGASGGAGEIKIQAGGTVQSLSANAVMQLGVGAGSTGSLQLTDQATQVNLGRLEVGLGGVGNVAVMDGAALRHASEVQFATQDALGSIGAAFADVTGEGSSWGDE